MDVLAQLVLKFGITQVWIGVIKPHHILIKQRHVAIFNHLQVQVTARNLIKQLLTSISVRLPNFKQVLFINLLFEFIFQTQPSGHGRMCTSLFVAVVFLWLMMVLHAFGDVLFILL